MLCIYAAFFLLFFVISNEIHCRKTYLLKRDIMPLFVLLFVRVLPSRNADECVGPTNTKLSAQPRLKLNLKFERAFVFSYILETFSMINAYLFPALIFQYMLLQVSWYICIEASTNYLSVNVKKCKKRERETSSCFFHHASE